MTQEIIVNAALAALDRCERQEKALRMALEALRLSLLDASDSTIIKRREAIVAVLEAL